METPTHIRFELRSGNPAQSDRVRCTPGRNQSVDGRRDGGGQEPLLDGVSAVKGCRLLQHVAQWAEVRYQAETATVMRTYGLLNPLSR